MLIRSEAANIAVFNNKSLLTLGTRIYFLAIFTLAQAMGKNQTPQPRQQLSAQGWNTATGKL